MMIALVYRDNRLSPSNRNVNTCCDLVNLFCHVNAFTVIQIDALAARHSQVG